MGTGGGGGDVREGHQHALGGGAGGCFPHLNCGDGLMDYTRAKTHQTAQSALVVECQFGVY